MNQKLKISVKIITNNFHLFFMPKFKNFFSKKTIINSNNYNRSIVRHSYHGYNEKNKHEFTYIKTSLLLLFLGWFVLFIISLYNDFNSFFNKIFVVLFILAAYSLMFIFTFITNWLVKYTKSIFTRSLSVNKLYRFYLSLISPHRFRYEINKDFIKDQEEYKTKIQSNESAKLIIMSNFIELLISTFILFIFIIYYLLPLQFNFLDWRFVILLLSLIFRSISRSNEIIIAFTKDCFERKNDSTINSRERIILAISSLTENVLNYAVSYHILSLLSLSDKPLCLWQSFARSFETNFFQNIKLNQDIMFPDPLSMLTILQFLTSISLIIFSVAMYASGNKDKKNH